MDSFINSKRIPVGYIVVAACMDDCAANLSHTARQWFADMGSKEIENLRYRQGFAFIGIRGRPGSALEQRAKQQTDKVSVSQIFQIMVKFKKEEILVDP